MSESENGERELEPQISRDQRDRGAPVIPARGPAPPSNHPGQLSPPRVHQPPVASPRNSAPNVGEGIRRSPSHGMGSMAEPARSPDAPGRIDPYPSAPPGGRRDGSGGGTQHPASARSPVREFSQAQTPAIGNAPAPNIGRTSSDADGAVASSTRESRLPPLSADDDVTIEILPPKKADLQPVDSSISPRNIAQEAVTSVPKKEKTGSSGRQNAAAKTVSVDPASTRKGSVGRPAKGSDADLTSVSKLFKSQEDANQRQRAVAEKMAQAIGPLAEALAMIDDDDLFAQTVEALKDNLAMIPMDAKTRDALDTMFEYIERKRSSRR